MARRPLEGTVKVVCDEACHRARGSAGGTDYAVPVGTPVLAPFAGHAYQGENASAGYFTRIDAEDAAHSVYLMHLSERITKPGQRVAEGEVIGYSGGRKGAPGAGSSTGPHLHAHILIFGRVHGFEEWLTSSTPAGSTGEVIPEEDTLSADDIKQIEAHTQSVADAAVARVVAIMKETARKTTRAQLYADAGPTGTEYTAETSPRAMAAVITTGFIFDLAAPADRAGQLASLRVTPYMLIDANSAFNMLPTKQYDNVLAMIDRHLARIASHASQ